MTRRSIILVVCGVLAVVVGLAVAVLAQTNRESAASETPAPVVEIVADGDDPAVRDAAVEVPEGTEAVAVELSFVPGGAGFVSRGDVVNVFALLDEIDPALVDPAAAGAGPSTGTVGVLSNVVVLDVSTTAVPRGSRTDAVASSSTTTTAPGTRTTAPTQITYLLAVPVAQVGDLVQAAGFHRLYVSVPAPGSPARPEAPVTDAQLLGPGA